MIMKYPCLSKDWLQIYPKPLLDGLAKIIRNRRGKVYVAGGAVREWYAGQPGHDLDLTVDTDAFGWAEELAARLGGAFIPLDKEQGVARLVWEKITVDFSEFRGDARTIEEDLKLRDFTINAMAVAVSSENTGLEAPYQILDPVNGTEDFHNQKIRMTSERVFDDDPLRLLRAYRFMAVLGFKIDRATENLIQQNTAAITRCAGERIASELSLIMTSECASMTIKALHNCGLLTRLFPELAAGSGMEQPASHHLDVLAHNLETMAQMEKIISLPGHFFPAHGVELANYIKTAGTREFLLWAALFHDLGKPGTRKIRNNRLTFHNHDRAGGRLFAGISRGLAWSNKKRQRVCRFIDLHMWPFHLNNILLREHKVTPKACLRLAKTAGEDLPGVFLLAMADSLAGQGPEKPAGMESSLARLYETVDQVFQHHIKPVLSRPRLLTGHDLQTEFKLAPGPIFSKIFAGLEEAQVNGEVVSRKDALTWVRSFVDLFPAKTLS